VKNRTLHSEISENGGNSPLSGPPETKIFEFSGFFSIFRLAFFDEETLIITSTLTDGQTLRSRDRQWRRNVFSEKTFVPL